jgi:basic amino acid/polyamine antiporter, APA family
MNVLQRTVSLPGAVLLGLGSILGTGVFVSVAIAVESAAGWVHIAIALAALVALCNGLNSAQLAAAHPVAGGTYEYGYRLLSPIAGFTAGWLFLLAKSASAATAALGVAAYIGKAIGLDGRWPTAGFGAAIVVLVTIVVYGGLRRGIVMNAMLVTITLAGLLAFVAWGLPATDKVLLTAVPVGGAPGVLEASALMFVAFTGYGRIATLGEEIREPQKNIPRAVVGTGAGRGPAPLEAAARAFGPSWLAALVSLAAVTAMLGVLLNLVLGLSRVWLAMGRRGDMPGLLARVDQGGRTPGPSVLWTGVVVAGLALVGDVRLTWSFSAFTVLAYYALTNAAALRLPKAQRRYPARWAWFGLAACLFLAFWVDWQVWATGLAATALGLLWHVMRRRRLHA